jgi:anthranilate phosphoribosyltransferase
LALEVTGACRDLAQGVERARAAIADCTAARLLERVEAFAARLKAK